MLARAAVQTDGRAVRATASVDASGTNSRGMRRRAGAACRTAAARRRGVRIESVKRRPSCYVNCAARIRIGARASCSPCWRADIRRSKPSTALP